MMNYKTNSIRFAVVGLCFLFFFASTIEAQVTQDKEQAKVEPLVSLGVNRVPEINESSGLALSTFAKNSIWTHNDSGHTSDLFLMKMSGQALAKVKLFPAKNVDWESMCGFKIDGKPYLMVGDVGDNARRREKYQFYVFPEPDLTSKLTEKGVQLPISVSAKPETIQFVYPDGSKNCEAIGVDVLGKQIWLVEKVYFNAKQKEPPGIYVLPLTLKSNQKVLSAKRIGEFPPRNVTGMGFSPDGKRLIIRNYVNSHLYSREKDETWEFVVNNFSPEAVVLPFQRQGEAVCFSNDSQSLILTSELNRQPIWQVRLESYFKKPRRAKKKSSE